MKHTLLAPDITRFFSDMQVRASMKSICGHKNNGNGTIFSFFLRQMTFFLCFVTVFESCYMTQMDVMVFFHGLDKKIYAMYQEALHVFTTKHSNVMKNAPFRTKKNPRFLPKSFPFCTKPPPPLDFD